MQVQTRVLLVEDEALFAEHVCNRLSGAGYAADYVVTGEECVSRLAEDAAYDLVLMDIDLGLESMSGADAGRHVRSEHDMPVLFYTGHTDARTIAPTREVDAAGCVQKSDGDFEILVTSIEHAVRQARREQALVSVAEDRERLVAELERARLHLDELNHRIKNNLALIHSLVGFSEQKLPEGYTLEELYHQIRAMRVLHHRLESAEASSTVELRSFLQDIITGAFPDHGGMDEVVELDLPRLRMWAKSATPLALLTSELALNARKHAFASSDNARFRVTGAADGEANEFRLQVSDNGVGLPEAVDLATTGSTGLRLVSALVRQLRGTVEVERDSGTTFVITIPFLHFLE